MMPTPKMASLFEEHSLKDPGFICKSQPNEIVQLKDNNKDLIDYVDTRSVRDMRTNLRRYNEFIENQIVEVCAPPNAEVNARFLIGLKMNLLKGVVDFNGLEILGQRFSEDQEQISILADEDICQILFPTLSSTISGSHAISKDMIIISSASNPDDTSYPITVSVDNNTIYEYITHIKKLWWLSYEDSDFMDVYCHDCSDKSKKKKKKHKEEIRVQENRRGVGQVIRLEDRRNCASR
jgi:hypothetical protein